MVTRLREVPAFGRLGLAIMAGLLVGWRLPPDSRWYLHILAGWCAAAVVFLGLALWAIFTSDAPATSQLATREDPSRVLSGVTVLIGSVISLGGVISLLSRVPALQKAGHGSEATMLTALGLSCVALSWLMIQVVYTFRYTHLYFQAPVGGIDFHSQRTPDYRDFFYLAVTMGMTFQVSDTNLSQKAIRRSVLGHGLTAFLFNTILVALTINVVAGLLH